MNSIDLLLIALVAFVCGTLAQLTSSYSKGGFVVNLAAGFFGALAGVVVSRALNAPPIYDLRIEGVMFPIVYSIIGSVFFLAGIGILIRPSRH